MMMMTPSTACSPSRVKAIETSPWVGCGTGINVIEYPALAAAMGAALVAMAAALVQTRVSISSATLEATVPAWSGPVLLVAGAGLVVAAVIGAEGARARLASVNFGWRQPMALLLSVVAGLVPLLAAGWWLVDAADDPLGRRDPVLLPAFIAAEGAEADQPRTLVLRPRARHRLAYSLLRADGPRLGDAETATAPNRRTGLDGTVADLASGRGGDAAAALLPYGVRFVLMTSPLNRDLARDIDFHQRSMADTKELPDDAANDSTGEQGD